MEQINPESTVSIVLAGGRGIRMRSDQVHKACFEVGGVPVILRALHNYHQAGLTHHVIVVGALGEQVLHAVGARMPNVSFVLQPEPLGTGNAARCGARLLRDLGYEGLVLVVVGDRLISPHVVRRLINEMHDEACDVVFLVGNKPANSPSGRVVFDAEGDAVAIVETVDIALSSLVLELDDLLTGATASLPGAEILRRIRSRWPNDVKAQKVCGALYSAACQSDSLPADLLRALLQPLRDHTTLELFMDGQATRVPAAQLEASSEFVNLSAYLFRAPVLYEALDTIIAANAQGEEYVTDCIKNLGVQRTPEGKARFRVKAVCLEHEDDSLTFNTPEELAAIERRLRQDHQPLPESPGLDTLLDETCLRPAADWLQAFQGDTPAIQKFLEEAYGLEPAIHVAKRHEFVRVLGEFIALYGPQRPTMIVRSPGRINLMGSHIDHRGGNTHVIAIHDEILMVAAPRDDDTIVLHNTEGDAFEETSFSISQEIARLDWGDWMSCVNSPRTVALTGTGDWSNYVRAAALRLQEHFRRRPLSGVDMVIHGTIPVGSGLSSSSAMVVGAAEVLVAANALPVRPSVLVDLCGEGEWFVGTRGGAADHAAIIYGRRGSVARVGFFPFEVLEFLTFFEDYSVVVCNSGFKARKSASAKADFNKRILGYEAGELIIRQMLPDFAPSIHHLRDVTCENLGLTLAELYGLVAALPYSLTRKRFLAEYGPFSPEEATKLGNLLVTLPDDDTSFQVRGVVLYGMAEIERARRCVEYLRSGDAAGFGALWYLSHDGDRITTHDEAWQPQPWNYEVTEEYLQGLVNDLQSGDTDRAARAQLHQQPGRYACSTERIDLIVDLARAQQGVVGAQIAGAGLGGCAIILVRRDGATALIEVLNAHGFAAQRYYPVEGGGRVHLR